MKSTDIWMPQSPRSQRPTGAIAEIGRDSTPNSRRSSTPSSAASPEFERGYAEGHALTVDDAVLLALAPANPVVAPTRKNVRLRPLDAPQGVGFTPFRLLEVLTSSR